MTKLTKSQIEQVRDLILRLRNKSIGVTTTNPTDWGVILRLDTGVTVGVNWKNVRNKKITFLCLQGDWYRKDLRNKSIKELKVRFGNFNTCNKGFSI